MKTTEHHRKRPPRPERGFVCRRMLFGAMLLGGYGVWIVWARLPSRMSWAAWLQSSAWAVSLLAGAGILAAMSIAGAALLLSYPAQPKRRPAVAAGVETALILALLLWLLLNELVFSTTSQVLNRETLSLVYHNPAEVLEAAWEMGGGYLIGAALAGLVVAVTAYRLSARSYRAGLAPARPATDAAGVRGRSLHLASGMTGSLVILAALLAWQCHTRPGIALTTVLRSAPPLRALNLTRMMSGDQLAAPAPERFGLPTISDTEYQGRIAMSIQPRPNVVLILLESVAAKALHCYGHPRADVSPNIDSLAENGTVFDHCVAAASFSSYNVVSIFTSLYMLRDEYNDYFDDKSFPFLGLPRALKLSGHELALFSSGNETYDDISDFYPRSDFDVFFSHDTTPHLKKADCMRMDDQHAVGAFEDWIAHRSDARPFYCGFYLQSTHFNYEVPEPWFSHYQPLPPLYSNGNGIIHIPDDVLPKLRNQYDNAMRYADYMVGRIRAGMEKAGQFDNSIIVIVADHGEAFMEHGLARHGVHLWEEMIHVPLIIHLGPAVRAAVGRPLPRRVDDTVSSIDIAPTVAELAGIPPHPSWQGVDVLNADYTDHNRPVFSILQLTRWMEAVVLNKRKYIHDLTDSRGYLFDLGTDPGEAVDLVEAHAPLAEALKAILSAWHTRQLSYYTSTPRPFTHYMGRYEPSPEVLDRFLQASEAGHDKKAAIPSHAAELR